MIALILIFLFIIFVMLSIIVVNFQKSFLHLFHILKFEVIYNILGARALLDDFIYRNRSITLGPNVGTGKVALITGGARGIGVEVVKQLISCDFQVIIGCRNVDAGKNVLKNIRAQGIKKGNVFVYKLDVGSVDSVKLFAAEVKQNHPKIHLLINNAGKMFGPYMETVDGYESQFATNYLGHFLLTHLLLPEIKAAGNYMNKARIVNVSSCAHLVGNIDFNDIHSRNEYIPSEAYAQSKLAQVLFTNRLNSLLQDKGALVAVYSVHPGIVNTDLFNGTLLKKLAPWAPKLFFKTPEQGATTIVFTCISPEIENAGGSYISNCRITPSCKIAHSTVLQKELFDFTTDFLGIKEFGKE